MILFWDSVEITGILSPIFGKNFVKVTDLLKLLVKRWFDEILFGEREFLVFLHAVSQFWIQFTAYLLNENELISRNFRKKTLDFEKFVTFKFLPFITMIALF